jgi:hypothetical protein
MIKEGAIEGASAAFGMHVMPNVPSGSVALRRGTIMAGALSFEITVRGRGGHAALPHLNVDPVVAAASLIGALQTLVSRETSPLGSAVLSVAMLKVGPAWAAAAGAWGCGWGAGEGAAAWPGARFSRCAPPPPAGRAPGVRLPTSRPPLTLRAATHLSPACHAPTRRVTPTTSSPTLSCWAARCAR